MANKRLDELTEITTLADDDHLLARDTSDAQTSHIRVDNAHVSIMGRTTVNTAAPLSGGGALSGDLTLAIAPASGAAEGSMSAAHFTKVEGIEAGADVTDAENVAAAGALMADGSVPMAGTLDLGSQAVIGAASIAGGGGTGTLAVQGTYDVGTGATKALLVGSDRPDGDPGTAGDGEARGGTATTSADATTATGGTGRVVGGAASDTSAGGGTAVGGTAEIDAGPATSDNGTATRGVVRIGRAEAGSIESGRSGAGSVWAHEGDLSVTGSVTAPAGEALTLESDRVGSPAIVMNASHASAGGTLSFEINEVERLRVLSTGVSVTGNVAVTGTVDGRDVATDGAKLDTLAPITVVSEAGTSRNLADSDNGKVIRCTSATGCGVDIPAGLTPGVTVELVQEGAGQVAVTGTGVTIRKPATFEAATSEQWSSLVITILDSDEALVRGDLEVIT